MQCLFRHTFCCRLMLPAFLHMWMTFFFVACTSDNAFFFFRIRLLRFRTGALLFCPVPFILWHEFSAAKSCNSCGAKYMDRTARCTHKMSAMWSAYHCKERETDTVHVTLEREWAGLQNCYWHCVIIITIIIIKLIFTGKWEICMNFFYQLTNLMHKFMFYNKFIIFICIFRALLC